MGVICRAARNTHMGEVLRVGAGECVGVGLGELGWVRGGSGVCGAHNRPGCGAQKCTCVGPVGSVSGRARGRRPTQRRPSRLSTPSGRCAPLY